MKNTKPPGIGTYGTTAVDVQDAGGHPHEIRFSEHTAKMIVIYPYITLLPGGDRQAIEDAVVPAILDFAAALDIGEQLNIPRLYGVAYAADPALANTFVVTDMQVSVPGISGVVRDLVPCAWNELIAASRNGGVSIRFS